jgi:hypothetical protein
MLWNCERCNRTVIGFKCRKCNYKKPIKMYADANRVTPATQEIVEKVAIITSEDLQILPYFLEDLIRAAQNRSLDDNPIRRAQLVSRCLIHSLTGCDDCTLLYKNLRVEGRMLAEGVEFKVDADDTLEDEIEHITNLSLEEFPEWLRSRVPTMYDENANVNAEIYQEEYPSGVTQKQLKEIDKLVEVISTDKCSICLEQSDKSVMFSCKHPFHRDCVKEWLAKYGNNCPLCRATIDEMCKTPDNSSSSTQ